eukprot:4787663-Prymnesium_polylepis.1
MISVRSVQRFQGVVSPRAVSARPVSAWAVIFYLETGRLVGSVVTGVQRGRGVARWARWRGRL